MTRESQNVGNMTPSTWRERIARKAETFLSARFLAPFALIVLILAAAVFYVAYTRQIAVPFEQGVAAMKQGNYEQAVEVFQKFILDHPEHALAPQARENAKFCNLMVQIQSMEGDRQAIFRQCESFLSDFSKSEHAPKVREVFQRTLYEEADRLFQEGKKARAMEKVAQAVALLDKFIGVDSNGDLVPQAKRLAELARLELKQIQEEQVFAQAKQNLLSKSEDWLNQKRFAALRAEIVGLIAKFSFAAQDEQLQSLRKAIEEKELAASSLQPAPTAKRITAEREPLAEPQCFLLMQRRCEARPRGVDGEVVFLIAKGRCLALDAATGECRWSVRVGGSVPLVPTVFRKAHSQRGEAALLAAPILGEIRRVGLSDGAHQWVYRCAEAFVAAPLVAGSTIYLATLRDGIHVLHAETGALKGKFWFDGELRHAPVLDEERRVLYVLPENGSIYVISLADNICRQIVPEAFTPYAISCSAVLVGDYLVLVEYQGLMKMRLKVFKRDESGLNLRAIRVGNFDIGENVGCQPVVIAGQLFSLTESGTLKVHGVNVRSEDAPLFPSADQWAETHLGGNYTLLPDTPGSPFSRGIGGPPTVLACGNGLTVYQFHPTQRKLERHWEFPPGGQDPNVIPGEAFLPPQRVGNLVCITTVSEDRDGVFLTAIDLEQKTLAWQVAAGAAAGQPVLDSLTGRVFVRTRLGSLFSIFMTNAAQASPSARPGTSVAHVLDQPFLVGNMKSEFPVPPPYWQSGSPGRIYVVTDDNVLHALDPTSGKPAPGWDEPFRIQAPAGPMAAFGGDGLVFGTTRGAVFIAPLTGSQRYCQEFYDSGRYSYAVRPAVGADRAIYIGNERGFFYRLTVAEQNGQKYLRVEARFKSSAPIRAGAVLLGESVFVGNMAGEVTALARQTLTQTARWSLTSPITCDLVAGSGMVFAASEAGCVFAISPRHKTPVWRFPREGCVAAVTGAPILVGQYLVFGAGDGTIYALRAGTGECVWKQDVGSAVSATMCLLGRNLVVPCADGTINLLTLPESVR